MASCFLSVIGWWIGFWDLRGITRWPVAIVLCILAGVIALFLAIAFVCPRLPATGRVDLWRFHLDNRRSYLIPTALAMLIGVAVSLYYGDVEQMPNQTIQAAIFVVMILAALAASVWSNAMAQRAAAVVFFAGCILFFVLGEPVLVSG